MKHSKKVDRIVRMAERQKYLQEKADTLETKLAPRFIRLRIRFEKKAAPLRAKLDALQAEWDTAIAKVRGIDRVDKLREDAARIGREIKVRRAALNGSELAALQATMRCAAIQTPA